MYCYIHIHKHPQIRLYMYRHAHALDMNKQTIKHVNIYINVYKNRL